jgi:hypothetical protein
MGWSVVIWREAIVATKVVFDNYYDMNDDILDVGIDITTVTILMYEWVE